MDTAVKWLILVTFSISGMLVWQPSFAQEALTTQYSQSELGNDSNLLIVFYVQIMPDDFVMQLHRF
ncbi:hypothetical protein E4J33_18980 [Salmonella enterica subsp. enterica serovar Kentucky]|nr:hypothetical protein [Salmonella enterica subsp. enterica serovar Kentucky]